MKDVAYMRNLQMNIVFNKDKETLTNMQLKLTLYEMNLHCLNLIGLIQEILPTRKIDSKKKI